MPTMGRGPATTAGSADRSTQGTLPAPPGGAGGGAMGGRPQRAVPGSIRWSADRVTRGILAGAAVGDEAVAMRRLTLAVERVSSSRPTWKSTAGGTTIVVAAPSFVR